MYARSLILLGGLVGLGAAQFPPKPEGVTVVKSKFHENVTISFKEPGICETTPGVKSYAGYVHLPPGFLEDVNGEPQNYPVNTFFWFIESRKDPENAPLAIWLNGGPGGSSLMGLLQENGPCIIGEDSKSTTLNPYSWNNEVNMLYIDEPTQVGFSYDIPTNFTVDLTHQSPVYEPTNFSDGLPDLNLTTLAGTFSTHKQENTANTTAQAAHALWHFAQTFFFEFPKYRPHEDRISIWAESYGGHYGPGFMRFFQQQNEKIADGTIDDETAQYIHLDTLGIVNGLIDEVLQTEAYISFPFNNTYGIQVWNETIYDELMYNFTRPGGCKDQLIACRDSLRKYDVNALRLHGTNSANLCGVEDYCQSPAEQRYLASDFGWLDLAHSAADPFPPPYLYGYLTESDVLGALGVPVNFTASSDTVFAAFSTTFDEVHGGFLDAVGYLLDSGVKVHMMYGDRDYACNWVGGERASLAIPYSEADNFAKAGYTPLVVDGSVDGMTRQYGNYSFSRVYQAGHEVPSYQPAAAYEIFMRATFNKDIATGLVQVEDDLSTDGPASTWHIKNERPKVPEPKCYVMNPATCTAEVWKKVVAGTVRVKDWFVVNEDAAEVVASEPEDDAQEIVGEL